jgi:hypothetical protein
MVKTIEVDALSTFDQGTYRALTQGIFVAENTHKAAIVMALSNNGYVKEDAISFSAKEGMNALIKAGTVKKNCAVGYPVYAINLS